jgi:hypothetical protein
MQPIQKPFISINNQEHQFLSDYSQHLEIPILPHPGAFSKIRKHHRHEGVDLYCQEFEPIYNIEEGIVVNILPFTGEMLNTPWWNNTWCVLIAGPSGVINYGEILPSTHLKIGDLIDEGVCIGHVLTVLKKDKGRPRNMLHLELYTHNTQKNIHIWNLEEQQPLQLLDPTSLLFNLYHISI